MTAKKRFFVLAGLIKEKFVTVVAETSFDASVDDRLAKRNALVLAVGQALAGANNTVIASTGGILGVMLAPDKGLATLPITVMVVGMWFGTLPVGFLARRVGRRFALQVGCAKRRPTRRARNPTGSVP